jgi:hypothetical protein
MDVISEQDYMRSSHAFHALSSERAMRLLLLLLLPLLHGAVTTDWAVGAKTQLLLCIFRCVVLKLAS